MRLIYRLRGPALDNANGTLGYRNRYYESSTEKRPSAESYR
jgi:hypothetical protein